MFMQTLLIQTLQIKLLIKTQLIKAQLIQDQFVNAAIEATEKNVKSFYESVEEFAEFQNNLIESCALDVIVVDSVAALTPAKEIEGEIDEIKYISAKELLLELKTNPQIYCPWMLIALELLDKSEQSMLEKHRNVLSTWMNSEVHERLQEAIKTHLPKEKWRLVNEKN